MAKFTIETSLLIHGVKGKINQHGLTIDKYTLDGLTKFTNEFSNLVNKN